MPVFRRLLAIALGAFALPAFAQFGPPTAGTPIAQAPGEAVTTNGSEMLTYVASAALKPMLQKMPFVIRFSTDKLNGHVAYRQCVLPVRIRTKRFPAGGSTRLDEAKSSVDRQNAGFLPRFGLRG